MSKYFSPEMEIEELRKTFRKWCLELHPDKGGNPADFRSMKDEYDYLCKLLAAGEAGRAAEHNRPPRYTAESEKELREALEKLLNIPGIVIEICGSWLWISGDTWPVHEQIKAVGCKFSGKKKMWYYSTTMQEGKIRGRYSMNKIREKFGSVVIESEAEEKKAIAA